jgi:hypothetical protein
MPVQMSTTTQVNIKNKDLYKQFSHIVGSIIVLFDTLPVIGLAGMIKTQEEAIYQTLMLFPSVLVIPKCQDGRIRILHSSFRDFLLDKQRCPQSQFWIDKKQAHHDLFTNCLRVMSNLRHNICDLRSPGTPASQVERSEVERCIPPQIQYVCHFWVHHLQ